MLDAILRSIRSLFWCWISIIIAGLDVNLRTILTLPIPYFLIQGPEVSVSVKFP